ncbi:MAG TPA: hypothetical protein VFP92_00870 [Rhodanobacteraceae bacterium]|nr:hypothetical protein [Rhodanobacteraceae bacterium]
MTMRVHANDGVHTAEMEVRNNGSFYAMPTADGLILATVPIRVPENFVERTVTFSISDVDVNDDFLMTPAPGNKCMVTAPEHST